MTVRNKVLCVFSFLTCDILAFFLGFVLASYLRFQIFVGFQHYPLSIFLVLVIIFTLEKLYSFEEVLFWDNLYAILKGVFLTFVFWVFLLYVVRVRDVSRLLAGYNLVFSMFLIPFFRNFLKRFLVKAGVFQWKILILGAGEMGKMIVRRIIKNPYLGYHIRGFLDDDSAKWDTNVEGKPVIGPIAKLESLGEGKYFDGLIIAMPSLSRKRLAEIVESCEKYTRRIHYIPDLYGLIAFPGRVMDLDGILIIRPKDDLSGFQTLFMKRAFDLVLGGILVALLSPLFAFLAIAIKLSSPGPVLYAHNRLGHNGREFSMLKFRTMYVDNEKILADHLASHPEARREWQEYAKLKKDDPRVTPIGRVLRRWSLDELPQLFSVLKGESSLVGPRAYLPREREQIGKYFPIITQVKPGMTGMWQVSGRSEIGFSERIALDVYYIRNWSLWMDFVLLIKTVPAVLTRRGAY